MVICYSSNRKLLHVPSVKWGQHQYEDSKTKEIRKDLKKKSGEDGHGAFGYHINATCVTTPSSLKAGPGLNVHPLQYPMCVRKTRKMNFLILSVVLGPSFDPCCHFLGPRKLRQEGVC